MRRAILMVMLMIVVVSLLSSPNTSAQDSVPVPELELWFDGMFFEAKWNADETQIAVYGDDESAYIFDAASGEQLLQLPHLKPDPTKWLNWVTQASWSPDETRILTSGADSQVKLWGAANGELLRTWQLPPVSGDAAPSITALWHSDSQRIFAYQSQSPDVVVWDVTKADPVMTLTHPGQVIEAIFSPDYSRLLVRALPIPREALVEEIAANLPDGEVANFDDLQAMLDNLDLPLSVYVWDTATGQLVFELPHDETQVHVALWSQDGTRILTKAGVDLAGPFMSIIMEAVQSAMEGRDDLDVMALLEGFEGPSAVRVWDAQTGALVSLIIDDHTMDLVKWSPDSSQIITTTIGGKLSLWDAATGSLLLELPRAVGLMEVNWSADMSQIYALEQLSLDCGMDDCAFRWVIWDSATGELLLEHAFEGPFAKLRVWNPDMTLAAWNYIETKYWSDCSGPDCVTEVYIMDPSANILARLPHSGSIPVVVWNAAGDRLLTSDLGGYVRVWAIDTILAER